MKYLHSKAMGNSGMKFASMLVSTSLIFSIQAKAEEKKAEAEAKKAKEGEVAEPKKAQEPDAQLKNKLAQAEMQVAALKKQIDSLKEENLGLKAKLAAGSKLAGTKTNNNEKNIKAYIAQFRGRSADRFKARQELTKIGKEAVPALMVATGSSHFYIAQTAIQTLGDINDVKAVPVLIKILEGSNEDLSAHANRSLGKVTRQYFGTIGVGETAEEKNAVVESWKKWWLETSRKDKKE
tara:strand:- start:1235 stop:1945 length:711 start_codon:yes stop_codon:yes gene_type:complete